MLSGVPPQVPKKDYSIFENLRQSILQDGFYETRNGAQPRQH